LIDYATCLKAYGSYPDFVKTSRNGSFEANVLWQNLRMGRLKNLQFSRKCRLEGYSIEFYCARYRIAIELRGSIDHEDGEFDSYRMLTLASAGVRILCFTNSEVRYSLSKVLQRITDACGGKGA
jgi:very-short-patch-repair endonuclease